MTKTQKNEALFRACESGDVEAARLHLEKGADIGEAQGAGQDPAGRTGDRISRNKEATMYCSNCGNEYDAAARFCPGCGAAVGNQTVKWRQ